MTARNVGPIFGADVPERDSPRTRHTMWEQYPTIRMTHPHQVIPPVHVHVEIPYTYTRTNVSLTQVHTTGFRTRISVRRTVESRRNIDKILTVLRPQSAAVSGLLLVFIKTTIMEILRTVRRAICFDLLHPWRGYRHGVQAGIEVPSLGIMGLDTEANTSP